MLIVFCLLPGDFLLSHHLFLKSLFLHALVIVNSRTYHTSDKNPFITSHVCGGTWRMTHSLHAFIVNITPEAEVLLKYHTCRYSPLFSPEQKALSIIYVMCFMLQWASPKTGIA